ncbi:ATP-dependent DNA helicase RecG [Candidatus Hepatincola sp. Av]
MQSSILDLIKPINTLHKIAGKTAEKLNQIGIFQAIDLLFYFPINMNKRYFCQDVQDLKIKEQCVISLKIIKYFKNPKVCRVQCVDAKGNVIHIVFFKLYKNYLEKYLPINATVTVLGVIDTYNNSLIINHPKQIIMGNDISQIPAKEIVYRRHQDISSATFAYYIAQVLEILKNCEIPEWLDSSVLDKYNFVSLKESLLKLHNPESLADLSPNSPYLLRVALDEIVNYHINLIESRKNSLQTEGLPFKINNNLIKPFLKNLPFQLTNNQIQVIKDIKTNLQKNIQSTNLLQGDVGSGKTVVCFILALFAIESGYQVAFMAPTDILAKQHYNSLVTYAKNLNLQINCLCGKDSTKYKAKVQEELLTGKCNIVIGTHALFQDSIQFSKLGLIIIDEQHRFGVEQRYKLLCKSDNAHIVLTTATPIPRTLALSMYGDINSFAITEKPKNRKEIITTILPFSRIEELLNSISNALLKQEKIFWVCPLIDESELLNLTAATDRFNTLAKHFPNQVLLIHGKMKAKEKEHNLALFKKSSKGFILVSTTVIEVGVDIPESNIMIIENAERFGLAQLHQLRGRVGRGEEIANCILLYSNTISNNGKQRLKIIKESNDGFYIAEKDLALRGAGDILGITQSGLNIFKVFDFNYHTDFMLPAIKHAKFLQEQATHNPMIAHTIKQMSKIFQERNNQYIKHG